ncbi:unnamed protein product [Clonostachys rosea f. rosea IK726]|uniref:Uncharacterized protein n=1 Tax=Clonostachys rosea f. rosea IK726 TaxID=1349383 RepID=A0ACA9URI1_BIOOC|nr:unnamed protein product [Clonostachys rosea f. rosea IK726]
MTGSRTKPRLPIEQLSILAVARFAEPIAYTSVFPYLPAMIRDFGIEQNKVARWAGLTSAVFSIAQSITAVPWGKASDRFGRKPVLICGLMSTMVTFLIWGMSTSLPMAITVRAIQGAGNGNVGIIRTMVAEMVTERVLQPKAFSIMPLVWSIGSVVGPSFGGFFAQPAKQYPNIFGNIELFKKFPYLLPNLVGSIFFLISMTSAIFFLKETLVSKRGEKDWGLQMGVRIRRALSRNPSSAQRRASFVDGEATAPLVPGNVNVKHSAAKPGSAGLRDVFTRQSTINLVTYTFLAFHSVAYDQNIPVYLNHPRQKHTGDNTHMPFYFNGGFGLDIGAIGTIVSLYGVACGLIQFLIYSPLVTRYGVLNCFKVCSIILPFTYFFTPYCGLIEDTTARYTALAILMTVKAFGIIIAFPSTTILLTNSATSLSILGTLNGFATTFSGLGRAAGPALTGLTFTWGAEHGYIVAPFAFLAFFAALGAIPVFMIHEGDGPTATPELSEAEDNDDSEDTLLSSDEDDDVSSPLLGNPRDQGKSYNAVETVRARD